MPTPKNNTQTVKTYRDNLKNKSVVKIELLVTESDKKAFQQFKKDSGIDKNSDAFRKLIEIANINDNQKFYII